MTIAPGPPIRVRAIAFDLDGTLLDTIHDLATAINMMLVRLGRPRLSKDVVRTMVGKGVANLVRRALAATQGSAPSSLEEARALAMYEADYERILGRETVVFPGVREGLERLASAGFGLACVTNKTSRFVRPHLEQAGLASYFSLVVGGDSLPEKKPDPLPLRHAARHFCVAPGRLLMLGDSANDTQAARAAGCPVFCVPYGYNEGRPVQSLDCDGIVSSLDELPERIRLG
ncbi:MAG: phosphoglycolate phosphatase [Casimicrobiaceae bacterium]